MSKETKKYLIECDGMGISLSIRMDKTAILKSISLADANVEKNKRCLTTQLPEVIAHKNRDLILLSIGYLYGCYEKTYGKFKKGFIVIEVEQ